MADTGRFPFPSSNTVLLLRTARRNSVEGPGDREFIHNATDVLGDSTRPLVDAGTYQAI